MAGPLRNITSLLVFFYIFLNKPLIPLSFLKTKVAPPRLNARVGLFSTRSPHRPNPVGLTLAKLDAVEGDTLYFSGHDLLDGTPVLDVKPYIPDYDAPKEISSDKDSKSEVIVRTPKWVNDSRDDLSVSFTPRAVEDLSRFSSKVPEKDPFFLREHSDSEELKGSICDILKADPRSAYRREKCTDQLYYVTVSNAHCTVWFDDNVAEVLRVKPQST